MRAVGATKPYVANHSRRCPGLRLLGLAMILFAAQAVYGAHVRVPEGTLVSLALRTDVTTENVVKGDRVEFDVSGNVVINDEIVIPAGARAWAVVERVHGAGKKDAKDASVTYRIMGVNAADGQSIALRILPTRSRKPDPTDNDIVGASVLPGAGSRRVGVAKGTQYAAYTDGEVFVNTTASITPPAAASVPTPAPAPQAPQPAAAVLPEPATVDFRSDPAGSNIVIDGSSVGITPTTMQLTPGMHQIEIRAQGYQNWKRTLRVEAGSHPTVMARLVQ